MWETNPGWEIMVLNGRVMGIWVSKTVVYTGDTTEYSWSTSLSIVEHERNINGNLGDWPGRFLSLLWETAPGLVSVDMTDLKLRNALWVFNRPPWHWWVPLGWHNPWGFPKMVVRQARWMVFVMGRILSWMDEGGTAPFQKAPIEVYCGLLQPTNVEIVMWRVFSLRRLVRAKIHLNLGAVKLISG